MVGCCQRKECALAAANATIERGPALEQKRNALRRWRNMPSNGDFTRPKLTRLQRHAAVRDPFFLRQTLEHAAVDVCDCASRVKLRRLRGAGVHSLELALSFNVGNRQPLPGGQCWIAGVVLAQSLIELMRTRVLPLDACQDFCELLSIALVAKSVLSGRSSSESMPGI